MELIVDRSGFIAPAAQQRLLGWVRRYPDARVELSGGEGAKVVSMGRCEFWRAVAPPDAPLAPGGCPAR